MSQSTQKPKIMVENISCILPQQSQLGALFLGNVYGAQNPTILKQYGIRAVLTSSIETDINYQFQDVPFHMKIQAHDKENYNLKEHINKCIDFIEKARQLTNVYVHCFAGVSRSAAIVCAYIMWKLKWNYETTIAFVKAKRIVAKPNQGFVRQLLEIQQIILGQSSYISNDQFQPEKSPSIISQLNINSIAAKQPLQYQNSTLPVQQHLSKELKKQINPQQRATSTLVMNQPTNGIQKNIQNPTKVDQSKLNTNSFETNTFTPQRYQNVPVVTSQPVNHIYQNIQAPVQKTQKSDRFLYLQNFFPQNHLTQQVSPNTQKSTVQNQKVIDNTQKPRNNLSLNSTGQNWMSSQNSQQLYVTSTQGFKNTQNHQGSAKNLINPALQKAVSSTSQLILGGKKPTYSHNSTPVPKVLQKRQQQKSNHHLQRVSELPPQTSNRTMIQAQYNHRASQGIEIMPKVNEYMWSGGNQQQKFSIRNMLSEQNLKSPTNNNEYNKKFDFRNATITDGFYNSKSTSQQKQSQKTTSRLLVRPKDLPGYKNY